jgi:UDP-GlcNAc:undecaprenyl-phosphate GlcNAc-1-phosphate transferase
MLYLAFLFFISLTVTWLAVPLASLLGRRMGAWDQPDELGIHKTATPRTGGIAMAVGLFIAVQLVWSQSLETINNRLVAAVVTGSAMVFLVGLLDDLREIKPLAKALGLVAAAIIGQMIAPHAALTGFERLDFIIGVVVLLLGANALNLMDGMDGLASGVAAVACLGFTAVSAIEGRLLLTAQAAMVAGAALGFWLNNHPPAKIFMGDCGSLMLGFILAGMALRTASYGTSQALAALTVVSLPALDTALAIVRRLLSGKDIFTGDRKHIYDLLYLRLHSVWSVNLVMYLLAAGFAGMGVAMLYLPWPVSLGLLAASWMGMFCWMVHLGMFSRKTGN